MDGNIFKNSVHVDGNIFKITVYVGGNIFKKAVCVDGNTFKNSVPVDGYLFIYLHFLNAFSSGWRYVFEIRRVKTNFSKISMYIRLNGSVFICPDYSLSNLKV